MSLSRALVCGLVSLTSGVASATTWNVAQTGCNNSTCTPCCTIQAAVEKSSGGDTISIGPGTYVEQVDIRNMFSVGDITFAAAGGPGTVVVSPSSGRSLTHGGTDTNSVTVEGINFTSPDMTCVFLAHSGNVALYDVSATGCGNHGFEIDATGTVSGGLMDGNAYSGVRIRDAYGTVFIGGVTATSNLEEGIEIDVEGPVTIVGNTSDGNVTDGLNIDAAVVEVPSMSLRQNTFTANGGTGVALLGLGGSGPFKAKCNDIAGNASGMYLSESVTVDARHIWWGDPTGPSGQGPGAGDAIFAEPGGTIQHDPWLPETFAAPVSGCPLFESDFESGLLAEWDETVP